MKNSLLDTLISELRNESEEIPKGWKNLYDLEKLTGASVITLRLRLRKTESRLFRVKKVDGRMAKMRYYNVS